MEKFLLKQWRIKLETWQIGLGAIAVLLVLVTFGSLTLFAHKNYHRAGVVSKMALKMSVLPSESQAVLTELVLDESPDLAREQRFAGQSGFERHQAEPDTDDLILLSRYDGDNRRSIVELRDSNTGAVLHTFAPDVNMLREHALAAEAATDALDPDVNISEIYRPDEYAIFHPWIEDNGDVVFKDYQSPMVRTDACGNHQWTTYGRFHHSIQRDGDGNFWTASRVFPSRLPDTPPEFESDSIVKLSPQGDVLVETAISDILLDNDMDHYIYMGHEFQTDPYHINDVEPALTDGPYWKRGDVFLSLRNRSMVILYRPSTHQVLWYQIGPWKMQHDVDIISDHEISVFSNNAATGSNGMFVIDEINDVMVHDLSTDETTTPWREGFERLEISTFHQGLSRVLDDGRLFVEEQVPGRLLMLDADGELLWSYINGSSSGEIYNLKWSRYIDGARATAIRAALDHEIDCAADAT